MDPSIVAATAGIAGSLIGGLTSLAGTYINQRHQVRRERMAKELDRREGLYGEFIAQASALFVDSLDKEMDDVSGLVRAGALLGRIQLSADPAVVASGKTVLDAILVSYNRPPVRARDITEETRAQFFDPISAFTGACCAERDAMLRAL